MNDPIEEARKVDDDLHKSPRVDWAAVKGMSDEDVAKLVNEVQAELGYCYIVGKLELELWDRGGNLPAIVPHIATS